MSAATALTAVPLSYKIHTVNTLVIGLGMTLFPTTITRSTPYLALSRRLGLLTDTPSAAAAAPPTRAEEQALTTIGFMLAAIGMIDAHAWWTANLGSIRGSVPLRIALGVMAALHWLARPRSRDLWKLAMILEDGLGGIALGAALGSYTG